MRFVSWNVNGFRAVLKKGFEDIFAGLDADFFCLQETKMQEGQADFHPEGYYEFYNYAEKKGYSGTAIFAKKSAGEPLSVAYGINGEHDDEGNGCVNQFFHWVSPFFFAQDGFIPFSFIVLFGNIC